MWGIIVVAGGILFTYERRMSTVETEIKHLTTSIEKLDSTIREKIS